jgi:hypothetical protein
VCLLRIQLPLQTIPTVQAVLTWPKEPTDLQVTEDGFDFEPLLLCRLLVALTRDLTKNLKPRSFSEISVFEPDMHEYCLRLLSAADATKVTSIIEPRCDPRVQILCRRRSINIRHTFF